jgi:hypothetical protein
MKNVGIFYGHLEYFMYRHFVHFVLIWYIFPFLVSCTKKNLATLILDIQPCSEYVPVLPTPFPSDPRSGADFMKPFRPNFRDKT